MGRTFFLMMVCCGLLLACDKEGEAKSPADANAEGQASATATAATNDTPPPASTGTYTLASANPPGLTCWTPAGLIEVEPGAKLVMVPGAGCDPHPATTNLKITEGEGPFSVQQFAPGVRLVFQPATEGDEGPSCATSQVKANLGYPEATVGITFSVVPTGCDG